MPDDDGDDDAASQTHPAGGRPVADTARSVDDALLTAIAADVLRLLGNRTRLEIVRLLSRGELSVGEVADRLSVPLPTVSQHLARLRVADVVTDRRVGTTVFYSMSDNHVTELVQQAVWYAGHMITDEEHRGTALRRGWQ